MLKMDFSWRWLTSYPALSSTDILNPPLIPVEDKEKEKPSNMTAEEERELAELLGSDDEDL
jgi:hypothetical protein